MAGAYGVRTYPRPGGSGFPFGAAAFPCGAAVSASMAGFRAPMASSPARGAYRAPRRIWRRRRVAWKDNGRPEGQWEASIAPGGVRMFSDRHAQA
jgi:hypothetical protein